ncbi:DUF4212 domain-containing protein [Thalassotalea crassostreae]|uniref:DUF4212 domain-containing protein n=1 Tax=Thalassotalea crassostreae TaxID=1763536 RepID=UPI000839522B|nr:sodium/substrate symporter small subunit [Thalassotalea crassostreae]
MARNNLNKINIANRSTDENLEQYWQENKQVFYRLLSAWIVMVVGCSVVSLAWLDVYQLFGVPLGYWLTHEGAMLATFGLVCVYHLKMKKIRLKYGFDKQSPVRLTKQKLAREAKGDFA